MLARSRRAGNRGAGDHPWPSGRVQPRCISRGVQRRASLPARGLSLVLSFRQEFFDRQVEQRRGAEG